MRTTTAGIYLFNAFGIAHVGGDICGFIGDTTPELCTRWTNIGAFYPFARNRAAIDTIRQEPYNFREPFRYIQKQAINTRYSLLSYLYGNMWKAARHGGTVWKPQFANFPDDKAAYESPEENIMIGDSLKLAVSYSEEWEHEFYFPKGMWANVLTGELISGGDEKINLNTHFQNINMFLREGKILPW